MTKSPSERFCIDVSNWIHLRWSTRQRRQCLLDITIGRKWFWSGKEEQGDRETDLWFDRDSKSLFFMSSVQMFKSKRKGYVFSADTDWMEYCICVSLCKPYAVTLNQTMSVLNKRVRGWCSCNLDSLSAARQISVGDWLHLGCVWRGNNNCCNRVAYYTCGNCCISSQTCYIEIYTLTVR